MIIWLVHHGGEPTPIDPENFRMRRMGMLAEAAALRGHDVVWWNSTFFHIAKTQRFAGNHTVQMNDKIRVNFIRAKSYHKNISLARIQNHRQLGREFASWARREKKPDLILSSLPILEMSDEAVLYGCEMNVPVVLDIRDIWPDAILDMMPTWTQPVVRIAMSTYFRMAQRTCKGATAICGVTDEFVQWGLNYGGREVRKDDGVFPFGYKRLKLTSEAKQRTDSFWNSKGIRCDPDIPIICFFGLINHQFDFDTVFQAVNEIQQSRRIQLVICGKGETLEQYRQAFRDNPDICFPGWVDAEQIWTLMQRSSFGLAPYINSPNFQMNIANKPIEYLAGGLPLLCSLSKGPLSRLTEKENCGIVYNGSASTLRQALEESLVEHTIHTRMVRNAHRVFNEKYDALQVYEKMVMHLESVQSKAKP